MWSFIDFWPKKVVSIGFTLDVGSRKSKRPNSVYLHGYHTGGQDRTKVVTKSHARIFDNVMCPLGIHVWRGMGWELPLFTLPPHMKPAYKAYTVLKKRNFPPRNRQNNFFLLMWGKSFLDHCIMARVLHSVLRLEADVLLSSIFI